MGIASLILGVVSTLLALFDGSLFTAAIGGVGAILGLAAMRRGQVCAGIGLLLSVNGVLWSFLIAVYQRGLDPVATWLGLG